MKRKQTLGKNSTVPVMLLNVMKDPNNQSVDKITSFSPLTPVEFGNSIESFRRFRECVSNNFVRH